MDGLCLQHPAAPSFSKTAIFLSPSTSIRFVFTDGEIPARYQGWVAGLWHPEFHPGFPLEDCFTMKSPGQVTPKDEMIGLRDCIVSTIGLLSFAQNLIPII